MVWHSQAMTNVRSDDHGLTFGQTVAPASVRAVVVKVC